MKKIVIAIDGPAGAGKSTIAKIVADRLGIMYIDTGAMYRAVTLRVIKSNTDINDLDKIYELLIQTEISLADNRIYINGDDITEEIRFPEVSKLVSHISAISIVRSRLVDLQRKMAVNSNVVMDGRDIGTNVLKDASVKIFLTASVEERSIRRYKELIEKGYKTELDTIKQDICRRDEIDSSREINPLRKAEDAIVIDTTCKSIDEVVDEIISIVNKER